MSNFPAEWLEAARVSKAWPFEEARKLDRAHEAARLRRRGAVRDRLRPLRPAAYRHVRRGGAHRDGAARLPGADRRQASGPGSSASPTTWMACARFPTTCRTRRCCRPYLGKPLTEVPDPFTDEYPSLRRRQQCAAARLPRPLRLRLRVHERDGDYRSGRFDATLLKMLANYDEVKAIMLPTLGPERRATYSPFLPISPRTGIVLQVPTIARDPEAGTITYIDPDTGEEVTSAGHRRARQVPVEGRLGAPLGGARRRLRDVGQGPDRFRHALVEDLQGARRHAAGRLQLRALPRRARARRSPSRRATASPSTSG